MIRTILLFALPLSYCLNRCELGFKKTLTNISLRFCQKLFLGRFDDAKVEVVLRSLFAQ
jgi:hypothetical protein